MEGRIKVRARVRHHLDFADVELGAWSVERPGSLAAEEVADERSWKALVGYHSMFHDMTYIDQHGLLPCGPNVPNEAGSLFQEGRESYSLSPS
jgi:hypothetical protein